MGIHKKSRLLHNFLSLGIVQGINSLLQLLVIPYVIRIIGVDGFGVVAVAQVVMFYLSVFTDFGFHQTATRDVAIYRNDNKKISQIFFRVFFTRLFLCFVAFIILLILLLVVPVFRLYGILYITGFVFVIGNAVLANWFFQGMERMQFIAAVTLLARLIFVALIFIFLKHKGDGFLFLLFLGAGNIAAGIISIITAWRIFKLEFARPLWKDIWQELREGWHIALTNLSSGTCQYANIFILSFFTNDTVTGYYSIAERIFFTIRQGFGVLSQAVYPRVCQLVQEGKKQVISFFRKVYIPFLMLTIAGAILLFIFSPWVIYFFAGSGQGQAVWVLRMFCIVSVVVCTAIPFSLGLLALNQRKNYFRIYALATVLNIIANIILAHFFGAAGTVMAVLLTELFIMAGMIREVNRYYQLANRLSPGMVN